MWVLPMIAAGISLLFAALLGQQFVSRHKPQQLAWAVAMLLFAAASFSAAVGMLGGWGPTLFRAYYLCGAVLTAPILALGTLYLFSRKLGHFAAVLVVVGAIFAIGVVAGADLNQEALRISGEIPSAGEVLASEPVVRQVSRYYSFAGFLIVVAGALWSAWKLAGKTDEGVRSLAAGNVLIAAGTLVVAIGSIFARYGSGAVFSVGLAAGVTLMFAGFLKTRQRREAMPAESAAVSASQIEEPPMPDTPSGETEEPPR